MKAYSIEQPGGPGALKLHEVETPRCGPHQALVKMHAHSLNYRDLVIAAGGYPHNDRRPVIPVSDGAGEVVEVGSAVSRVRVGDRVMPTISPQWVAGEFNHVEYCALLGGGVDGTLAEYGVFDARSLVRIPDSCDYEEAATLPCAAVTAWEALMRRGRLAPGQTVLILGTGGVAVFALLFSKMVGARVIVISKSNEKLAKARALGADGGVNYVTHPDWGAQVRELTQGRGVDHVLETGGGGTLEQSIASCALGGTISLVGILTGFEPTASPIGAILSALTVQGIYVGSRTTFEQMNQAVGAVRLRPIIDRVFPFEEAARAYEYLATAQHFGKVVISHP